MKFGTLLSDLAKKAGVDTTQQDFVSLLSHDIEIPDAIATKLNQGLLNIDAAKNNPDIKKALRAEALNGVDSKISELLEELGITSEATEILEEKNSFEKIAKLTRKVKELESKKAGSTKKEDKDALELKIADLNKELKTAKDSMTAKEKEWQDLRNGDLTNFEIQKKLLGKDYSLPKEMNADLKVNTAQTAINMALQAKGYKLVRNEQGSLQIVDKDGGKAYSDTHEELQVDSFIDGALAQNKLLKVNDQSQSGSGNSSTIITNDGSGKGNASIVAEIDGALFK
jgi:NADH dehydrogenase/NADH:ubiquinone oxidoreductase subunit G